MKTLYINKPIIVCLLLMLFVKVQAGVYIDGGVSYQRTNNVAGTRQSDTISRTDVLIAYSDKVTLPLGLGSSQADYAIRGKYLDAKYARFSEFDYTEWLLGGDFRKNLSKQWWLRLSTDYLIVDTENGLGSLDRLSLGVENGYHLTQNLLLTAAYQYRNTAFDNRDDHSISHGYAVGGQYNVHDFFAVFARYKVDNDYIDRLGFVVPDTRITRLQGGILLALNEHSALQLMVEDIDNGQFTNQVFSTDVVLRY